MATEIEMKFLVCGDDWKHLVDEGSHYRQGYLSIDPARTVRIRTHDLRGFLTVKGLKRGISCSEYEYEIPYTDAVEMLGLSLYTCIEKIRYKVKIGTLVWEIDEYMGANEGLVIAEVELPCESIIVDTPSWVGKDVSGDIRYSNSMLSFVPFTTWGNINLTRPFFDGEEVPPLPSMEVLKEKYKDYN